MSACRQRNPQRFPRVHRLAAFLHKSSTCSCTERRASKTHAGLAAAAAAAWERPCSCSPRHLGGEARRARRGRRGRTGPRARDCGRCYRRCRCSLGGGLLAWRWRRPRRDAARTAPPAFASAKVVRAAPPPPRERQAPELTRHTRARAADGRHLHFHGVSAKGVAVLARQDLPRPDVNRPSRPRVP